MKHDTGTPQPHPEGGDKHAFDQSPAEIFWTVFALDFMPFQSELAKVSWSTLAQGATCAHPTSTHPDHAGCAADGSWWSGVARRPVD